MDRWIAPRKLNHQKVKHILIGITILVVILVLGAPSLTFIGQFTVAKLL